MIKDPRTYLVADLFCGAGGSSSGAKKAIESIGGTMDLVAVNHWNTAIATHSSNHPGARHVVEDVSLVQPEAVVEEGRLDLLMASPECTYHSRARGGKPIHDQGRMQPWAVHNWLTKLNVQCVLIENVPEFVEWGPLDDNGRPIKSRKGEFFQTWYMALIGLGYQAEWRMLNAADYGDATTRVRFFLMARKDGQPIVWPEPSHIKGDPGMFPGRLPWRGAREIIDWTNPGKSLLDDPKYLKKPLSEKTRRRIARGLERFGGPLAPLYIRLLNLPDWEEAPAGKNGNGHHPAQPFHGTDRQHTNPRSMDDPIYTITGLTGGGQYKVEPQANPFILNRHGENGHDRSHSLDTPVPTADTRGAGYLVQPDAKPFIQANRNHNAPKSMDEPVPGLTSATGGGMFLVRPFLLGQQSGGAPRDADKPTPTITADGAIALLQPHIIRYNGQSGAEDVDEPLSSMQTMNHHALAEPILIEFYGDIQKHGMASPFLVQYYGNGGASDCQQPAPTITTKDRFGLAQPSLVEVNHGDRNGAPKEVEDRSHSVDEPLGTLTTKRGTALVNPILVQTAQTGGNGIYAKPVDAPLGVVTTRSDMTLVNPSIVGMSKPYLVANFGEAPSQEPRVMDVDSPTPTVTSRGAGSLVTPTLDEALLESLVEAQVDPMRIVVIDGQLYLLDIRFRMLQNAELARAMGFEDDETPYEFHGTIAEVTKQIGNAVPVNLAAALVRAALTQEGPETEEVQA